MFATVPNHVSRREAVLVWWGRVAVVMAFGVVAVAWVGWATGVAVLTRVSAAWPPVTPWTAVLVALLAVAVGLQSDLSSNLRMWISRSLAVFVGGLAVVMLVETMASASFGLNEIWFRTAVNAVYTQWPGRPSTQTLVTALLLSIAVAVTNLEPRWVRTMRATCLLAAGVTMSVDMAAYLFGAHHLVTAYGVTGTSILTNASVLLLVAGTLLSHPERDPLAWLIARPDSKSLIRMIGVFAGLPVLIGLLRAALLRFGVYEQTADALGVAAGVGVAGMAVFYLSQREQGLLIAEGVRSRERAEAEARYRILADNAVDVVLHLRDGVVVWVSPSVQAAFGNTPEQWIGLDFLTLVHPDDVATVVDAIQEIDSEQAFVTPRFRVRTAEGGYHWVDGPGRPYIDAEGNIDGTTGSMRIIDDQVEAEQQLQRLARFDTLTGLVNRAEALARRACQVFCVDRFV